MDNLLTILTPLIIAVGAIGVFALARRENKRKNERLNRQDFVVRTPYVWGGIMATIELLLLAVLIFGNIEEPFPIGINILVCVLILVFGYGILQSFREKVRVRNGEITYTPPIGSKKVYTLKDIESVESKRTGVYVYVNGKKAFTLDPSGIGTALFVEVYKTRE